MRMRICATFLILAKANFNKRGKTLISPPFVISVTVWVRDPSMKTMFTKESGPQISYNGKPHPGADIMVME